MWKGVFMNFLSKYCLRISIIQSIYIFLFPKCVVVVLLSYPGIVKNSIFASCVIYSMTEWSWHSWYVHTDDNMIVLKKVYWILKTFLALYCCGCIIDSCQTRPIYSENVLDVNDVKSMPKIGRCPTQIKYSKSSTAHINRVVYLRFNDRCYSLQRYMTHSRERHC